MPVMPKSLKNSFQVERVQLIYTMSTPANFAENKTVLITGATDGIGMQTAYELAEQNARVHIVARNEQKAQKIVRQLNQIAGKEQSEYFIADLSLMSEVKNLASQVNSSLDNIDILINNAGVFMKKRVITSEGLETTFAVNHISYFLLTMLLLDKIKSSAPARIINVSSMAHMSGNIDFSDLQYEKSYNGNKAYADSKLMNILFTKELAERLKGSGVTVNCLHPGVIDTKLLKAGFGSIGGGSLEEGAVTSVHLATSNDLENVTAAYFSAGREKQPSRNALNKQHAKELFRISEEICNL